MGMSIEAATIAFLQRCSMLYLQGKVGWGTMLLICDIIDISEILPSIPDAGQLLLR
jgi:hypothetical protein